MHSGCLVPETSKPRRCSGHRSLTGVLYINLLDTHLDRGFLGPKIKGYNSDRG